MVGKLQSTRLHQSMGLALQRLDDWALNPWRRYSLLLIVFFAFFIVGSSIGVINGVLALMDPIGAFITVFILEVMIRLRRSWKYSDRRNLTCQLLDFSRIGLLYGLLLEGFKLL